MVNGGSSPLSSQRVIVFTPSYQEIEADDGVSDAILIRENDGEWREPSIEVEE